MCVYCQSKKDKQAKKIMCASNKLYDVKCFSSCNYTMSNKYLFNDSDQKGCDPSFHFTVRM